MLKHIVNSRYVSPHMVCGIKNYQKRPINKVVVVVVVVNHHLSFYTTD